LKKLTLCLNEVELAVLTLYMSTTKLLVQSVVYTYLKVVKQTQFSGRI